MEIALIENVQRENLNAVEECDAYRNIMDKCNYAMSDLTKLIGKSESYIRNILRLKSLPDNVKEMVKSGEITSSHARTLAASGNAEEIARRIADEKLSVAEVSNLVRAGPRAETAQRSARKKIHYPTDEARKIELEIERKLQVRAKLAFRAGGKGTLQLAFENSAQMELLVATLTAEVESNM
jgi:ParB family chromosome partitioning protein